MLAIATLIADWVKEFASWHKALRVSQLCCMWTFQATVSEEIDMSVWTLIDFFLYDSLARNKSHLLKSETLIHQQSLMFTLMHQLVDFFQSNSRQPCWKHFNTKCLGIYLWEQVRTGHQSKGRKIRLVSAFYSAEMSAHHMASAKNKRL